MGKFQHARSLLESKSDGKRTAGMPSRLILRAGWGMQINPQSGPTYRAKRARTLDEMTAVRSLSGRLALAKATGASLSRRLLPTLPGGLQASSYQGCLSNATRPAAEGTKPLPTRPAPGRRPRRPRWQRGCQRCHRCWARSRHPSQRLPADLHACMLQAPSDPAPASPLC